MKPPWVRIPALAILLGAGLTRPGLPQGSVRDELTALLRSRLEALDSAQRRFHADRGTFAGSTWRLRQQGMFADVPGVSVVVLDAGQQGWSAVAIHRALPGIRCLRRGDAALDSTSNRSACSGEPDILVLTTKDQTEFELSLAQSNTLGARCSELPATTESGRVVFEGKIDVEGHLELENLSVKESPRFVLSYAGLYVISNCRFQPARIDDHVLPIRRLIPLSIRGAAQ